MMLGQRVTYTLRMFLTNTITPAPRTGPSSVPGPPSTTIRMPSVEAVMLMADGLMNWLYQAYSTPAIAANNPDTANASSLCSVTL